MRDWAEEITGALEYMDTGQRRRVFLFLRALMRRRGENVCDLPEPGKIKETMEAMLGRATERERLVVWRMCAAIVGEGRKRKQY